MHLKAILIEEEFMMEKLSDDSFRKLYAQLGMIDESGLSLPLHLSCINRQGCWLSAEDRFPPDDDQWAHLSRPWIGNAYHELRLLAIGENLNEYGGFDAVQVLTQLAKNEILSGRRRVRFGNDFKRYPGSFLWHRLGCYAVVFAQTKGFLNPLWGADLYPSKEDVSRAYDYISYTNHIKCSPKGGKSEQTKQMWDNCGKHILRKEIELLQPDYILILGKSDNQWYFNNRVLDEPTEWAYHQSVGMGLGKVGGREVSVFILPHPQAKGGNSLSILNDLRHVLR
jgi:hypothetical protein